MRVNGAMGVIAVSCVVAVVNGATVSTLGRSHMKTHRTAANIRRFTAMEFADAHVIPEDPEPVLETRQPSLHSGHFITLPAFVPDEGHDDIDLPTEPVHFTLVAPVIFGGGAAPLVTPPPPPPPQPDPPALPPITFRSAPVGEVPEPSTWAMIILGVGAVGAMLRRRREGAGNWRLRHRSAR
jgi:hypothetical protein